MKESKPPYVDLLGNPNRWQTWASREEVMPHASFEARGGPGGRPALLLAGNGSPHACGCWRLPLTDFAVEGLYRLEVQFQVEGVPEPGKSVFSVVSVEGTAGPTFYDHLDYRGHRGEWSIVSQDLTGDDLSHGLTLNLFLGWAARGSVRWAEPRLYDIKGRKEKRRVVNLGVVSGNPESPKSPSDCIQFYLGKIREIPPVDLICLPEVINTTRVPIPQVELAEPIPGPTSSTLGEEARERGCYIAASILEREGEGVFNTGVILDRQGGLLGKYRKTHLPPGEGVLGPMTPGEFYPVFETDFGRVGYMICWDGHFPEVPRMLSLKGAEVILFSNMGDGRQGGTIWEPFIRTRAIDNQVTIVAAVNGGRSCIVSPLGEVLAMSDSSPGSWVIAECDLDASISNFSGRPIHRRYDLFRRAESFKDLLKPVWDL